MKTVIAFALISLVSARLFAACTESELDPLFSAFDKPGVPGVSALVMRDGRVIYRKSFGLADLEEKRPATPGTGYRLASVSKQFTASAVLVLIHQGRLGLDDTLTKVFPDFPSYGGKITVRHLLNHTSGIRDYEDLIPAGQTKQLQDADVLELLRRQSSGDFPPGTRYRYSNSGYVLLGLIVEAVTGQSFAHFLDEAVFEPSGMKRTLAYVKGGPEVPERAYGYSPDGGGFRRTDQSVTSATLGDGGVYTSIDELVLWEHAVETGALVSESLWKLAFTPGKLNDGSLTKYGFGWMLDSYRGRRRQHHTGSTIGFRTAMARFPDDRFLVAVLANRANSTPWVVAERIVDRCLF